MKGRILRPERPKLFAHEYLANGRNATQAYVKIYEPKGKTAGYHAKEAHRVLHTAVVQAIVAQADKKVQAAVERVTDRYAITRETIAEELASMAMANMADYMDFDTAGGASINFASMDRRKSAAIAELVVEEVTLGRTEQTKRTVRRTKFKLADKRAALMDLARLKGYIVERKDVRVIRALDDLSDDELQALASGGEFPAESRH